MEKLTFNDALYMFEKVNGIVNDTLLSDYVSVSSVLLSIDGDVMVTSYKDPYIRMLCQDEDGKLFIDRVYKYGCVGVHKDPINNLKVFPSSDCMHFIKLYHPMVYDIKHFINILDDIDNSKLKISYSKIESSEEDYDDRIWAEVEVRDYINHLGCEFLITANGRCDWDNIRILSSKGYRIYAAEKDSFGWLIGAINMNNLNTTFYYG